MQAQEFGIDTLLFDTRAWRLRFLGGEQEKKTREKENW